MQRRYKDQDGQWQSTNSLDVNDIPKAILALSQAYTYLVSAKNELNGTQEQAINPEGE